MRRVRYCYRVLGFVGAAQEAFARSLPKSLIMRSPLSELWKQVPSEWSVEQQVAFEAGSMDLKREVE